ncbi:MULTISPECIES: MBL fold metallo-hydrolase [Clostridium]|uniref:MBL fold metallo-hydrolase n=1 Tax=Clostridium TaxID=1485 RepID=UPI0005C1EBCB|nr:MULTISPECIES: MBL fold metallo-hydrolase [Clostridium]KIU08555.1 metallo-beta-lactamase family protein [Clostridium butyricum]MBA8968387.1 glyoxylase-like metal-dependent hydrolase (beta-lactamase superfamily II) [Clostridium butyricum]MBA8970558.1 glyoxylase-like metal-dependent hydrolase (beta-lactamase superfamily II) [Clostridium butyricum]MBC2426658.1 MBL fold metallo-hydrolase [Clostridium butyricum]MBO1686271.1 MBL fold metallo-hydrolase [Clostridium butyricum]
MLNLKTVPAGVYEANCYILVDSETKDCAIIDAGGDAGKISAAVENMQGNPKYLLLTHGHFDHVGGVKEICSKYDIPFYISKTDEEYMEKDNSVFGTLPKASGYLKEGDVVKLGSREIKVIETPGHTKGGLCFLIDGKLFTGDTLFQGSIGRTDFIGGDMKEIISSIKNKLLPLGDDVEVYPGHGPSSSIKFEKMRNPYL